MLQKDLDTLRKWAVENEVKINPSKSNIIRITRTQCKNSTGLLPL